MDEDNFIKFLGTAGARFVVAKQIRYSAGTYVRLKNKNIIIDPGPGTLLRCAKVRPPIDISKIDSLILTHMHIDHTNDVNIMIDAMTGGGLNKRGFLFAPGECINGKNAVILNYLKDYLNDIIILEEKEEYSIGHLSFNTSIKHRHPVETYGLTFKTDNLKVSFIVDTKYFPQLIDSYRGSDILIINVVRLKPHKSKKIMHLSIHDTREIIKKIKPRKVFLTHFGMTMIKAKPWKVALDLTEETGIKTIAASDGMKLKLKK